MSCAANERVYPIRDSRKRHLSYLIQSRRHRSHRWNAAIVFGEDMDDVRAVLEFVNVELLEMRTLDEQLDQALDRGYVALTRKGSSYILATWFP